VPSELAKEREKFREEHLKIASEIKLLLEESTLKAVTVTQAVEQLNATSIVILKALEKTTQTLKSAAERVDVKSIGDRLGKEVIEQSIKPVTALNDKLEITRKDLSRSIQLAEIAIDSFRKIRWWIPWTVAFFVCGTLGAVLLYGLQKRSFY
jgi:hypothetical protein